MSRHGNLKEATGRVREKESVCSKRNAAKRKASS